MTTTAAYVVARCRLVRLPPIDSRAGRTDCTKNSEENERELVIIRSRGGEVGVVITSWLVTVTFSLSLSYRKKKKK